MDKLDSVRQQLQEEKRQFPNLVRPAAFRETGLDWRIPVFNAAGEGGPTIGALKIAKVASGTLSEGTFVGRTWMTASLTAPTVDNEVEGIIVNLIPIAPGETGLGTSIWPAPVLNTGGWIVGDEIGVVAGSFELNNTKQGFKVVALGAGPSYDGVCWIVPLMGGGGGPQGIQGPQGTNPGPAGPAGPAGGNGPQGIQGCQGWQGGQGPQGNQGWQGWQGRQGWQGWQGVIGTGTPGDPGTQGPQGAGGWPGGIGQYKVITCIDGGTATWDYVRGHS